MEERAAAAEKTFVDQGWVDREYLHNHRWLGWRWWQEKERGGFVLCCSPCLFLFGLLEASCLLHCFDSKLF